jgi:WD40 repeat protein
VHCLLGHIDDVTDVGFDHTGARIISGSMDSTIFVWDALSGQQLLAIRGRQHGITGVAFSPLDDKLVCASDDRIRIWQFSDLVKAVP